jgi:hypothetical protein
MPASIRSQEMMIDRLDAILAELRRRPPAGS